MLLFTIGSISSSIAFELGGRSSSRIVLPSVAGAIALIVFGIYESKPAETIFPYQIIRNRTVILSLICSCPRRGPYHIMLYVLLFFRAVVLETHFISAVSVLPTSVYTVGLSIIEVEAVM